MTQGPVQFDVSVSYGLARKGLPAPVEVIMDPSRQESNTAIRRVKGLLGAYGQQIASLRLQLRGVAPQLAAPVMVKDVDLSTPKSRAILAVIFLPYVLMITAFTGATHLAMDTTAGEKERRSLEPLLIKLVETRASQINGCAYCVHMHTRDARKLGEREERLYLLSAWEESPLYSARERAALRWTDALTLIAQTHAPDDAYEELRRQFSPEEIVKLTVTIGLINAWNRLAISMRTVHPGGGERAR